MNKVWEVFWRFLTLGCVSFGGPAAHIGYFQKAFVEKLGWIEQGAYARLIALSQFLPGPGSSQIGFALGLRRAGLAGGVAAFLGFTLPSFLLMYALAIFSEAWQASVIFSGIVQGLKLLAVVVVADATLTLYKNFCVNTRAISIALIAAALLLVFPGLWNQIAVLAVATLIGVPGSSNKTANNNTTGIRWLPLAVFLVLFFGLPLLASFSVWLELLYGFYQSGSLVFGGGHVVLPLLQETVGDEMATDRFLLGYAAAQAVPGPMFSFATFLGAELTPGDEFQGALLATLAIFLPGFLLVLGLQDAWETLSTRPRVAAAAAGINAAVVGLLLTALYRPVFISAVHGGVDMALVMAGLFLLRGVKLPVIYLVIAFAGTGLFLY